MHPRQELTLREPNNIKVSTAQKYQTWVKLVESGKHASLLGDIRYMDIKHITHVKLERLELTLIEFARKRDYGETHQLTVWYHLT
jgi:hypothetical protein